MKPEQQRIAIAKACGAKWYNGKLLTFHVPANMEQLGPEQTELADGTVIAPDVPDYLNDLNAMHEAEKALSQDNLKSYRGWLVVVCYGYHWLATAAQRAEAFLKTLNLWNNETNQ